MPRLASRSCTRVVPRFVTVGRFVTVSRFVCGAREEIPVKPDPAGALDIARRFHIPPGEILYVGDTNTDMRTAEQVLGGQ